MSLRKKFERKVREKEQEIHDLENKLMEARAYLQAMQDAIRLVPVEGDGENGESGSEVVIKPGSAMEAAVNVLRGAGKAIHIMDLLKAMGREPTVENRASVGSSIAAYVRKGVIFTRPAPNTFGLAEWGQPTTEAVPPDDFGTNPSENG